MKKQCILIYTRPVGHEGRKEIEMKYGEFDLITADELTSLDLLKEKVLYSDEIEAMSKERQTEIYRYCKLRATNKACLENLKQIRYAVTKIYFELGF